MYVDDLVRSLLLTIVLVAVATPAGGQSRQVIGYAGVLGEWELVATVTESVSWWTREFTGPLAMTHVGICTPDGPERKTGEIRMRISRISSVFPSMKATLLIDGLECAYRATRTDPYRGVMECPGRRAVPLALWLK
jgi:hypothetical protein